MAAPEQGKRIAIIGASLDLGSGRRGVDMGPSAIRYAGLEERLSQLGYSCIDRGNVSTAVLEAADEHDPRVRYLPEIRSTCTQVSRLVAEALDGGRELDPGEQARIRRLGIKVFTMSDVDRMGIVRAIEQALAHIAGPGFVHVSLDMDALDPEVAPGVGTPVRGGLSYREAHLALELVAESRLAGSLEVVEVNPILDRENATASLAVELVASALGKTIL